MENTSVCPSLFDLVGPSTTKLPVAFSCNRHRSSLQKLCFKNECHENRISDSRALFKSAYIYYLYPYFQYLLNEFCEIIFIVAPCIL
jgi:hypothetical protein